MPGAIEATLQSILKCISHFLHNYQRMAIVTDEQADLNELGDSEKGNHDTHKKRRANTASRFYPGQDIHS